MFAGRSTVAADRTGEMENWDEIKSWRKTQREMLIAVRTAIAPEQRRVRNDRITELLLAGFTLPPGAVVGFCWPYKGEFDARFVIRRWRAEGAIATLPVVIDKALPLQFRKWWPGAPMRAGVYGIPVPDGIDVLIPDIAIVPMKDGKTKFWRLGYGGGYFDRTLANLRQRNPNLICIGIAFDWQKLGDSQWTAKAHDEPLDMLLTESGLLG